MIAGCYSIDLYCENADPTSKGFRRACPHRWGSFPAVFTGETWGECVRQARRRGWVITRDRRAYCPSCSDKREARRG